MRWPTTRVKALTTVNYFFFVTTTAWPPRLFILNVSASSAPIRERMKNFRATKVGTSSPNVENESTELNLPANHMQDTLVKRCLSTEEWTDEKHSMYLKSMEASFVNQLYDIKQTLGWCSPEATFSHSTTTTSDQLKVLGGGCRKKIKFGRENPQISRSNEHDDLKANPWIQHSRWSSKDRSVASAINVVEDSVSSTCEVSGLGHKRKGTNPSALPSLHLCHQDMFFSHIEMSDQNFVDEEVVCQKENAKD